MLQKMKERFFFFTNTLRGLDMTTFTFVSFAYFHGRLRSPWQKERRNYLFIYLVIFLLPGCTDRNNVRPERPLDPWVFRSVLDKKPRMLTIAFDSACYAAYDLSRCALDKVWKGGVSMQGAVYSDKKNVQPTSWGAAYYEDNNTESVWRVEARHRMLHARVVNKGYILEDERIMLKYLLILDSGDTVRVSERPEFIRERHTNRPGLERIFVTSGVPDGLAVSIRWGHQSHALKANQATRIVEYYDTLPPQSPPVQTGQFDHVGKYWVENSDCMTCHEIDDNNVGPSFRNIAQRYADTRENREFLVKKIKSGGSGNWGTAVMNAHPGLAEEDIKTMLDYVFTLKPAHAKAAPDPPVSEEKVSDENLRPGFGAPLDGVHPAYDIRTIHPHSFHPRVGGLAFLPDGRLLVTTWDEAGGVYLLDGVETGDSAQITVKRIAAGLAEPLGIEVVNGEIYVLQKQELTRLIDHDNDDITDEYEAICNSWGVTTDFHEFAFGLVYKDGFFYATLSMAMRLMEGQRQHPDRGKTIRISKDGRFEWINYGLRTPNGIGIGVDNEIFITDNQGQWLPANKLIHVRQGQYHGMAWGLSDTVSASPPMTPPSIWLPEGEIGNSPSEPVLMLDGPYKGQMLHGDVTHGGIKRDFLEKVNGAYQGAVFRFSQGFEAGVNRLCWGPDSALYVGGIGMIGGWSWKEKRYGLQRMKYNGRSVFEMLSVKARPYGFEIEFTEPLSEGNEVNATEWIVKQWRYLPTDNYGGPKVDLHGLKIHRMEFSPDRKVVYLKIPGLKEGHVVYFRLPEHLKSKEGNSLWSSEAWYTLNNIPEN